MVNKRKDIKLDNQEQDIEDKFESLESYPASLKASKMKIYKAAAKNYLKKDKQISIRVHNSDLERIKMIAFEEGLSYEVLISSVLHKYSTGRLKDTHVGRS